MVMLAHIWYFSYDIRTRGNLKRENLCLMAIKVSNLNKTALRAVAQLGHIDIPSSVRVVRRHPLFDDEIHIEEELINYQEAVQAYHAMNTLQDYPEIRAHVAQEKRLILKHCVGMLVRMMYRKRLPQHYTEEDTVFATKKLLRLVVEDSYKGGKRIDPRVINSIWPLITWRQRFQLRERGKLLVGKIRPGVSSISVDVRRPALNNR
jgi:hypothetical protein